MNEYLLFYLFIAVISGLLLNGVHNKESKFSIAMVSLIWPVWLILIFGVILLAIFNGTGDNT